MNESGVFNPTLNGENRPALTLDQDSLSNGIKNAENFLVLRRKTGLHTITDEREIKILFGVKESAVNLSKGTIVCF